MNQISVVSVLRPTARRSLTTRQVRRAPEVKPTPDRLRTHIRGMFRLQRKHFSCSTIRRILSVSGQEDILNKFFAHFGECPKCQKRFWKVTTWMKRVPAVS